MMSVAVKRVACVFYGLWLGVFLGLRALSPSPHMTVTGQVLLIVIFLSIFVLGFAALLSGYLESRADEVYDIIEK